MLFKISFTRFSLSGYCASFKNTTRKHSTKGSPAHTQKPKIFPTSHNHHVKLCLRCHGQDAPRNHSCTPEATLTRWQHQFWPTSQGGSEVRSVSADYRLQGCHHPAHSPISQVKQCHVPHTKHTTGSQKVFLAVPLETATAPAAALQTPKRTVMPGPHTTHWGFWEEVLPQRLQIFRTSNQNHCPDTLILMFSIQWEWKAEAKCAALNWDLHRREQGVSAAGCKPSLCSKAHCLKPTDMKTYSVLSSPPPQNPWVCQIHKINCN